MIKKNTNCFMYDEDLNDRTCGIVGVCDSRCPFAKTLSQQLAAERKIMKRFREHPECIPLGTGYSSRITGAALIPIKKR